MKVEQFQTGKTQIFNTTDAALGLPDAILFHDGTTSGAPAVAVFISCETEPCRYALGVDPTNDAGTGLGHPIPVDGSIRLVGPDNIIASHLKFISKVGAAHAKLQITAEFGHGVVQA